MLANEGRLNRYKDRIKQNSRIRQYKTTEENSNNKWGGEGAKTYQESNVREKYGNVEIRTEKPNE